MHQLQLQKAYALHPMRRWRDALQQIMLAIQIMVGLQTEHSCHASKELTLLLAYVTWGSHLLPQPLLQPSLLEQSVTLPSTCSAPIMHALSYDT